LAKSTLAEERTVYQPCQYWWMKEERYMTVFIVGGLTGETLLYINDGLVGLLLSSNLMINLIVHYCFTVKALFFLDQQVEKTCLWFCGYVVALFSLLICWGRV
jgi:hypothetical protein